MSLKRVSIFITAFLCIALASSAQAQRKWSLTGGGGQVHIGDGLMLPIQAAATAATTGTMFPNLLVPVVGTPVVTGTFMKPLLTAMATSVGPVTKSGYQRELHVPAGALAKGAALTTVGVKFSNPVVFAVASNLDYTWPNAAATFSTGNAVATTTITGFGGSITYSNTLGSRFGGAGQFALSTGGAAGIIAPPVTVFLKINTVTPACVHTLFTPPGTPNPLCLAGLIAGAVQSGTPPALFGAGGPGGGTVMTPGAVLAPNVAAVQLGTAPLGTIVSNNAIPVATGAIPTNMATSMNGPWTTGRVTITNGAAGGAAETFTLSGKDSRTAEGGGTIQLVSGAVSARTASGPNANRGWVQLELSRPDDAPSLSPMGLAAMTTLIVLAGGYAIRRRMFA